MPIPEAIASHPPAQKVAGRRMSITARSKPHNTVEQRAPSPQGDDGPIDYPRPAAPGEQPQHHEEEHPRRERQQGLGGPEHERRLQEDMLRKAELNRPRKDLNANARGSGARISQPAAKAFGV
ncbi:hypothetical protein PHLCEN_2v13071 [Hermanssonia centrifuga]|uniref:Uncharacterized protein n=1 Tax=Hermanssonia centrifuga TaxID=98765 RepID=A0A2R6NGJ5_9APHY|nr:hypothetical protein PHLCEN_2v13071 [Hermanssonia centrifuga]